MFRYGRKRKWFGANDNDALIPEIWANESVAILSENMVAANLVHRDFSMDVASEGDLVHTRQPGTFTATRKTDADDVTVQDATLTDIQVPLDQHFHTSFTIKDGELSKSMKDLIEVHLEPAVLSIAQATDKIILGQWPQFLANNAGMLGGLSDTTSKEYILNTRKVMNENLAFANGRNLVWNPDGETQALNTDIFITADKVGDDGTALREASMGRKLGFDHYMDQHMSYISAGNTVTTGEINFGAGYAAGSTVFTVDGFSAAIAAGSWLTIEGDMTPLRVVSTVGGATPTSITVLSPGIKTAVVDDADITVYTPGEVNLLAGYAAGYAKEITVDGFTVAPQIGQFVTFGDSTTTDIYTIIAVTGLTGITLDRPLGAAIANNDDVCIGPAGSYNFGFHRNAITFVSRPLALPRRGTGALSAVASSNDVAIRVTITYQGTSQGHLVTVDLLCGVMVLDTDLGAVLLG